MNKFEPHLSERLVAGGEDEERLHDEEDGEHAVEDGLEPLREEDRQRQRVDEDAEGADGHLEDAVQPPADVDVAEELLEGGGAVAAVEALLEGLEQVGEVARVTGKAERDVRNSFKFAEEQINK